MIRTPRRARDSHNDDAGRCSRKMLNDRVLAHCGSRATESSTLAQASRSLFLRPAALSLTADNKKPVTMDRDGLQVTLVAGRGFEPLTFRLLACCRHDRNRLIGHANHFKFEEVPAQLGLLKTRGRYLRTLEDSDTRESVGHQSDLTRLAPVRFTRTNPMPRRATERLTDKLIRALPKPHKGAVITYDAEVPGFGIRVTKNDVRSFVLNYVVSGRERRMTIGRFPTWSATAAREEAKAHRRKVDAKIDPMAERAAQELAAAAERSAPTGWDLFERYKKEHLPHKRQRSAADDQSMWQKIILPRLSDLKVSAVRSEQIDALHAEVGAMTIRREACAEIRKRSELAIFLPVNS